ncbi:TerB family tellurite resistance protein [Pontibacter sp. 172403-2]|uniref:TerB family tellurite resistance protein n=1 Tax=Pontibacter rufus TaxID=2791028 RepID=UPI0018AFA690|nr:TerB family tellurite resistance protein [Pontibacter sp. 172403-2]MBF9252132.1 TerB family tellurite resistance protein [Pontibacter sp. 172403-2]
MRKIIFILLLTLAGMGTTLKANAQADEIAQLLLNVEKLAQFKQILSDMKKGHQIVSTGYDTVKDLSKDNFSLHKNFLDGLMQVSPTVRNYKKVADIIDYQILLVKEYKNAFNRFKQDNNFTTQELDYLGRVYNNLFKQSLNNLDDLATIITANKLRMSDGERLKAIDDIFMDTQDKVQFLRHFNNNTTVLAVQRAKDKNDVNALRNIYGLTN